jgi:hypothetical protein
VTLLDRVSQAFHQRPVVERLAQEPRCSLIECTSPVFVVWECGNQNYGRAVSPRPQLLLQVKTAYANR